jgi:DUF2892 family protein
MNACSTGQERTEMAHSGHSQCSHARINVGDSERQASLVGGGVLATLGLLRGSLGLAALGAGLIYRGATGHCYAYEALGFNSVEHAQQGHPRDHYREHERQRQRSRQFLANQHEGAESH